ncbi:hypothetical protein TWF730_006067 [Orbilia blumenaviensis]|uniref:Uncharacterized protein n=1 Tax=Orbilia blumenaviensis TaxID=1796055 RepID=A0AAV9VME3_9PEZI
MLSSTAADEFGAYLRVTQLVLSAWTTNHTSELIWYLRYSSEVRKTIQELKEEPYISLIHSYSKKYVKDEFPDNPFAFFPWQEFIDVDLLTALQKPWEYKWKMPFFTLSPEDRIKGLSSELLEIYPRAEIENEDAFDNRPLLLSNEISTVEYLAEFSLPFKGPSALTTWLFNPITLPAAAGEAGESFLYIETSRRERVEDSLTAIRVQLETIIEGLKGFDLDTEFAGNISIAPDYTPPIIAAIRKTIEGWKRARDVVGVMITIMDMLRKGD